METRTRRFAPRDRDATPLADLVAAAVDGDQRAWNELVQRFTPLVLSVIRRYRLTGHDADDVRATLWLRLVEHLADIREPRALPGWIAATTKHEALRVLGLHRRVEPTDPVDNRLVNYESAAIDTDLLGVERRQAVQAALAELRPRLRDLMTMIFAETPISYQQISTELGIPLGSIGPTRARCVDKLRANSRIQALAG